CPLGFGGPGDLVGYHAAHAMHLQRPPSDLLTVLFAKEAAMPRALRLTAALTLGAFIAIGEFTTADAAGVKCKKFKKGMTISDCPKEACGTETNLILAKNRTDDARGTASPCGSTHRPRNAARGRRARPQ